MLTVNTGNDIIKNNKEGGCSRVGVTYSASQGTKTDDYLADEFIAGNKFGDLIRQLRQILGKKGLTSAEVDVKQIEKVMRDYESNEDEWGKYALCDGSRNYCRNGIVNINGNANLLILVWNPGKGSAIHDHANAHCCMKILKGTLQESLYDMPEREDQMHLKQETSMHRDQVGYISDDIGLHKITNPLADQVSVSLHLYTPPFASLHGCCIYDVNNGKKVHVDMSKYYSWQGRLLTRYSSEC